MNHYSHFTFQVHLGYGIDGLAEGLPWNVMLAEFGFENGPLRLNGVEIRRVGREVLQRTALAFNQDSGWGGEEERRIIHYDKRTTGLFDRTEDIGIDRTSTVQKG